VTHLSCWIQPYLRHISTRFLSLCLSPQHGDKLFGDRDVSSGCFCLDHSSWDSVTISKSYLEVERATREGSEQVSFTQLASPTTEAWIHGREWGSGVTHMARGSL
jgi:hypothetical protein